MKLKCPKLSVVFSVFWWFCQTKPPCGPQAAGSQTNTLHALRLCTCLKSKSPLSLSFRVSQSPTNVHLIILFRERQACPAPVCCCCCCCGFFWFTFQPRCRSNNESNCMLFFLSRAWMDQPVKEKRAQQLNGQIAQFCFILLLRPYVEKLINVTVVKLQMHSSWNWC